MSTFIADFARRMHAQFPNDPARVREEVRFAQEQISAASAEERHARAEHAREHPEHEYVPSGLAGFCAQCWGLGAPSVLCVEADDPDLADKNKYLGTIPSHVPKDDEVA